MAKAHAWLAEKQYTPIANRKSPARQTWKPGASGFVDAWSGVFHSILYCGVCDISTIDRFVDNDGLEWFDH